MKRKFKTMVRERDKERFLQLLRAHIVIAGGREIPDEGILSMKVGELLEIIFNNDLDIKVCFDINNYGNIASRLFNCEDTREVVRFD